MTEVPTPPTSPFSSVPPTAWVASNELAFAIADRFPVSPGHTLVVPWRLVATYFGGLRPHKMVEQPRPMRSNHLPTIANVRLLVGSLGERLEWWRTQFTAETSRRSLELLFPQTAARAALESVTDAARRTHDDRLGPKTFHLFRLPVHLEDRLAGWLARADTGVSWAPTSKEDAMAQLARFARASDVVGDGQLRLGKPARLNHETAFAEIAGVYLRAARDGVRVVPYFEE